MNKIMLTEYLCECGNWFKKSQREDHIKTYDHIFTADKRIVRAKLPEPKQLTAVLNSIPASSSYDFPNTRKCLKNLRLLMQANGIIEE